MKLIIENKTLISIENITEEETHLTIPAEIKHIAAHACKNLKFQRITILEGVETIEEQAFSSCPNLDTVVIPNSCKKIGKKAFYDCKGLENVFFNVNDCEISSDAFSVIKTQSYDDFSSLLLEPNTEYNITENFPLTFFCLPTCSWETMLQLIGASDIYYWKRVYGARDNTYDVFMYGFHHGETLEKLGKRNIFIHNDSIINSCVLPNKKARFCDLFGEYHLKLNSGDEQHLIISYAKIKDKKYSFEESHKNYVNYKENHEKLIAKIDALISELETETKAKIDVSTKEKSKKPFRKEAIVKEDTLFIPYGVITIKKDEYIDCAHVTRIVFPDTVMKIEQDAFSGFAELKSVEFSGKPLYISDKAFGETVFHYCTKNFFDCYFDEDAYAYVIDEKKKDLDSLSLNSIWEMDYVDIDCVIKYCVDEFTYFYNTETQSVILCSCNNILAETIHIPAFINESSVTHIGAGAFSGLTHIKNVEVPSTVQSIGWRAFAGCVSLQSIYVYNYGNVDIDSEIFHNCESLQFIQFKSPPSLPSKYIPLERWANWLNDGYKGKYWYDPSHDSDQYYDYSSCEMLEKVMFSAPFPKIHIEQMSTFDISGMHNYGDWGIARYSPQHIIFKEQSQEQGDKRVKID